MLVCAHCAIETMLTDVWHTAVYFLVRLKEEEIGHIYRQDQIQRKTKSVHMIADFLSNAEHAVLNACYATPCQAWGTVLFKMPYVWKCRFL